MCLHNLFKFLIKLFFSPDKNQVGKPSRLYNTIVCPSFALVQFFYVITEHFVCVDRFQVFKFLCKITTYKMNTNRQVGILGRISRKQRLYMFEFFQNLYLRNFYTSNSIKLNEILQIRRE